MEADLLHPRATTLTLPSPERCQAIAHRLAWYDFPWDVTRSLELALFRTFASPRIAGVLHATGEFERRAQRRYDDTDLILATIVENGFDSDLGRRAIAQMNAVHGRFRIRERGFPLRAVDFHTRAAALARSLRLASADGRGTMGLVCLLARGRPAHAYSRHPRGLVGIREVQSRLRGRLFRRHRSGAGGRPGGARHFRGLVCTARASARARSHIRPPRRTRATVVRLPGFACRGPAHQRCAAAEGPCGAPVAQAAPSTAAHGACPSQLSKRLAAR